MEADSKTKETNRPRDDKGNVNMGGTRAGPIRRTRLIIYGERDSKMFHFELNHPCL